MPTGGGKSLCYQLPAMALPGLTLVVSPLIALMKDQVDALEANGVPAGFINSAQTSAELSQVVRGVRSGETKLLYVAPERTVGASVCRVPGDAGCGPDRHRRGALRVGVGARVPSGIPAACRPAAGMPGCPGDRPDGHCHRTRAGRHPLPTGPAGPPVVRVQLQPAQPDVLDCTQGTRPCRACWRCWESTVGSRRSSTAAPARRPRSFPRRWWSEGSPPSRTTPGLSPRCGGRHRSDSSAIALPSWSPRSRLVWG